MCIFFVQIAGNVTWGWCPQLAIWWIWHYTRANSSEEKHCWAITRLEQPGAKMNSNMKREGQERSKLSRTTLKVPRQSWRAFPFLDCTGTKGWAPTFKVLQNTYLIKSRQHSLDTALKSQWMQSRLWSLINWAKRSIYCFSKACSALVGVTLHCKTSQGTNKEPINS